MRRPSSNSEFSATLTSFGPKTHVIFLFVFCKKKSTYVLDSWDLTQGAPYALFEPPDDWELR